MFDTLRKHAVKVVAAVFAVSGLGGCQIGKAIPGAKTVEAVNDVCMDRPIDEKIYCFSGAVDGLIFAAADERAAGTLSPKVDATLDTSVEFIAPRLITVKLGAGKVSKYRSKVEALEPLAKACIESVKGIRGDAAEGMIAECMAGIGYQVASGELANSIAELKADWGEIEPRVRNFVDLGKQEELIQ